MLDVAITSRRLRSLRRLPIFLGVGLFNTAAFFLLASGSRYALGLGQGVSAYLAYALVLPISFLGHRGLTFVSKGAIAHQWVRFSLLQATNLIIIWAINKAGSSYALPGWIAYGVISFAIPALNFIVLQILVFHNRDAS
jgi:putative flippase GtrA